MDTATAPSGRFLANDGFDGTNAIFLLADDSNADIELQVHAPGMKADESTELCRILRDRLDAALTGLNSELIVEVNLDEESKHIRVVVNNPDYAGGVSVVSIVLDVAKAIVQSSEHSLYRHVIALKQWECAVLVDWDEPFIPSRKEYTLSLPAKSTSLDNADLRDQLSSRIQALCGNSIMVTVLPERDAVRISLWSTDWNGLRPSAARAFVARALFALGTVVTLRGINHIPVVQLATPFTPFEDDGSEPPERYIEY